MQYFKGKKVWITGASSGIGESLAKELSKQGGHLILSGRNEAKLQQVKEKCHPNSPSILILPFDLSNTEHIEEAVKQAIDQVGTIDLLINNGGISQRSLAHETDLAIDRKIMNINYFGNIALTKAILPFMLKQGGGHIAVTTSIVGKFGFPLRSAYSASKHALYGFYDTLRAELHEKDIKVTMICPGRVHTNISLHAINRDGKEHGQLDEGQKTGISSQKAAKTILKALKRQKKEVFVGGKELLMVHIKRFIPSLFDKIARQIKPT